MADNILKLVPQHIGDGAVLAADQILSEATGKYGMLAIVGETQDGEIEVCGTHSSAETALLVAWAHDFLIQNRVVRS